ncbi:hypothetical protein E2C01_091858 [Portunus trituberculatus]|uniref:Uncharacterized protein n=1 Tax=Portunus trituberculatus TaxID=210409 RepID=A0A5B7JK51_PORTR|nr:hypothetical protein [Portunus trituberculatus]
MDPGVIMYGYDRRGSTPVLLKKAQVRRRTAGCREGWTLEAARRKCDHKQLVHVTSVALATDVQINCGMTHVGVLMAN